MKTAVITTGGMGTRLLTYTKDSPKAMVPLFEKNFYGKDNPVVKPLIEIVFENLFEQGFRNFCFIIGNKGNSIYHHFSYDEKIVNILKKRNLEVDKIYLKHLNSLERKIKKCNISWIKQETPMGFGDALLKAEKFVSEKNFLLHAGDLYLPDYSFFKSFLKRFNDDRTSGTLLLQHRQNHELSSYGIAKIRNDQRKTVLDVKEKPKNPISNLVILPVYLFNKKIFSALKKTKEGHNNELQLTDGIKTMIEHGEVINSYNFRKRVWFDVGTSQNYFKASNYSFRKAIK